VRVRRSEKKKTRNKKRKSRTHCKGEVHSEGKNVSVTHSGTTGREKPGNPTGRAVHHEPVGGFFPFKDFRPKGKVKQQLESLLHQAAPAPSGPNTALDNFDEGKDFVVGEEKRKTGMLEPFPVKGGGMCPAGGNLQDRKKEIGFT